MALPDILTGLLLPAAYPHDCDGIRLIETHISWVLLTGDYAYKIKKPVRLPFVDFGTIERRHFFCDEELRCNRRFAPDLYLDVIPICRDSGGALVMGGPGEILEWAVRMRQFAPELQLDRLLEAGSLTVDLLQRFGGRLAEMHATLPRRSGTAAEVPGLVLAPVAENFATLSGLDTGPESEPCLARIRDATDRLATALDARFAARLAGGFTRECHGDLHLGNLVLRDGAVTAFDCLEFDANLRWIDTQSDVAFLFMDCLARQRQDLAYAFLDGYLDVSGDYPGVALLPFYAVYRAMVRAKVAAIEARQARDLPAAPGPGAMPDGAAAARAARLLGLLRWADAWLRRPPGRVLLMSGLSGSGKSYLAERLAPVLPAVRVRSDVARRHLAGSGPTGGATPAPPVEPGAAGPDDDRHLDAGRYAPAQIQLVYDYMAGLLPAIVKQGESVILDATFISRAARRLILDQARRENWLVLILHCSAPLAVLEDRIRQREAAGRDPSEADLGVLRRQLARQDPFGADEPVLDVDTAAELDDDRITEIRESIDARLELPRQPVG